MYRQNIIGFNDVLIFDKTICGYLYAFFMLEINIFSIPVLCKLSTSIVWKKFVFNNYLSIFTIKYDEHFTLHMTYTVLQGKFELSDTNKCILKFLHINIIRKSIF